ncbi:MAG: hypothetical protein R6U10_00515 [Thermoplasmatota archaeon]
MEYAIFEIESGKESDAKMLEEDDLVSRQTITIRNAKALGLDGDATYIKIEGSDEAIERAVEMVEENELGEKLSEEEAKDIYDKIAEEEESASQGMGMIFE